MIDHALLATVSMWIGKVAGKESVRLTEKYYKFEEVYDTNALLCDKLSLP